MTKSTKSIHVSIRKLNNKIHQLWEWTPQLPRLRQSADAAEKSPVGGVQGDRWILVLVKNWGVSSKSEALRFKANGRGTFRSFTALPGVFSNIFWCCYFGPSFWPSQTWLKFHFKLSLFLNGPQKSLLGNFRIGFHSQTLEDFWEIPSRR